MGSSKFYLLLAVFFACELASVVSHAAPPDFDDPFGASEPPNRLVEVEGQDFVVVPPDNTIKLKSYSKRRRKFGFAASVGLSNYSPKIVRDEKTTLDDPTVYGKPVTNLIELQIGPKWNLAFGSLQLDLGIGQYFIQGHSALYDSSLAITPMRLGMSFIFDRLFSEPYLAPYLSGGAYQMSYSEQGGNDSVGSLNNTGSTGLAPYFAAGINIQLNWLDRRTALSAFHELKLLNGFLFIEGRYFASASAGPDLSSVAADAVGGVRIEF